MKLVKKPIENELSLKTSNPKTLKRDKEDIEAINDVLNGKKNSFDVLYKHYYKIIKYRYSVNLRYNNELAEDLTTELFIKIFNNLHKFNKEHTFNSWITRVANNFFIDYTRKIQLDTISIDEGFSTNKTRSEDSDNINFEIPDKDTLYGEEIIIDKEKKTYIDFAISLLDERSITIIKKFYFEQMSYKEISDETGITIGNLKTLIFRAKDKLYSIITSNSLIKSTIF